MKQPCVLPTVSAKNSSIFCPKFDYQFKKHFIGSEGFSHYNTYVYDSPTINKRPISENHPWLKGTFIHENIWNFSSTIEESNLTVRVSYLINLSFDKK